MRRNGWMVAVAMVAAAVGPGWHGPPASAAASPTVTVTPADGLADGQTVRVTTSGIESQAFARQCGADPRESGDCDWMTVTPLDDGGSGSFAGEYRASAIIHTETRGAIDCRTSRCVLAASSMVGMNPLEGGATTALAFDRIGPLLPAPSVTLTPGTDLLDGQLVRIDGRDFGHRGASSVQPLQCGPQPSFDTCRPLYDTTAEPPELAPDGSFNLDARVWHVITTDGGNIDCQASLEPCLVVATTRPWETFEAPWAARVALDFDTDAPPAPDPGIEVSPASGLHDVTELTVRGRDFTPGGIVRVGVCEATAPERCDMATAERPTPDARGTFELRMNAFAEFEAGWDVNAPVDCRASGCLMSAEDVTSGRRATVPLAFGPPDPPLGRYRDRVFDDVEVDRDIVYRRTVDHLGIALDLRLDVYRPAGDTATSRPAVLWMHGGWFVGGTGGGGMPEYAAEIARRGYVGVDIGYRVRPGMNTENYSDLYDAMVDAYEDGTAAVQWVRAHAEELGVDPEAIAAGGFSAGAVTTTNLAYMPGQLGPATSTIAAALPLEGWFVRPDDPALPLQRAFAVPDPGEPPAIVFHGTADQLLPFGSPTDTCPMAAEAGIVCEYVGYEGDTHGSVSGRLREVLYRGTRFLVDQVLEPQGYFDVGVDAGGPYEVREGSAVRLAGSASGRGLTYAWSPGDHLDDPSSPEPTFTAHDDGRDEMRLTVTNEHGTAASDTAEVTTVNAPPVIGDVDLRTEDGGRRVTVTAPASDPGQADTHEAWVDWGDGTAEALAVTQGSGTATASGTHTYARAGAYEVSIRVVDDDGGTDTWSGAATVGCTINGTSGDDRLVGTNGNDVICGLGGDDAVWGRGGDDVALGGSGDDRLYGGRGDDVLDGGEGSDRLYGGGGDDVLDGGEGSDRLHDRRGDDVLDGGPGRDRAVGGSGRDSCDAEARRSCGREV
jgi:acetyl esterase/lipase